MFQFIRKVAELFRKVSGWLFGSPQTSITPPSRGFGEWVEELRPQWLNIISSYVKAVRYHPEERKLEVNYLHRRVCTYNNISPNTFADMLLATSKGRWARAHLFPLPYD